jgi:hypothetical protein
MEIRAWYMASKTYLDKFPSAMSKHFLRRSKDIGYDVWPSPVFHPSEADPYIAKHLFPRLYSDLQTLKAEGYDENRIAKLFVNPSRIARLTYLYHAFAFSNLPANEALWLAEFLLRLISYYREDVFLESGKNLIFKKEQIENLTRQYKIISFKEEKNFKELQDSIAKLNILIANFLELLYFCHQHIGLEVHGPYNLQNNIILLIRDAYDIRPPFWEFCKNFKYNRICLLTIYKNAKISLDYAGRIFTRGTLKNKLIGIQLLEPKIDSDIKANINILIHNLEDVIKEGILYVNNLDKKELMKKYGEMFFYAIKPIRDELQVKWEPPEGFYKDIENGIFEEYTKEKKKSFHLSSLSLKERRKHLENIWDIKKQLTMKNY